MELRRHALLAPAPGTQRELVSLHFGPADSPAGKAYLQASLHADELPGMLVAHHLRQRLSALEAEGRLLGEIVLVPMANPIGLSQFLLHAHQGRFELTTGENFNRHYPDQIEAVALEVEDALGPDAAANVALLRRALKAAVSAAPVETELQSLRRTLMQLSCDADIVLDLHCDAEAVLHLYTETPCAEDCEPLQRFLGARLTLLAQDSGDNPFDEACSQVWWTWKRRFGERFPIPQACLSVTVELRGAADVRHDLAAADAERLLQFLQWRGLIQGERPALPAPQGDARPLAGSMPIRSDHSGVLTFLKEVGSEVRAGEVLAEVIDPLTAEVWELRSPVDGLLFARDAGRFASAGMRVAKVAGHQALRSGKLLGA
jgi:hypothetical protein